MHVSTTNILAALTIFAAASASAPAAQIAPISQSRLVLGDSNAVHQPDSQQDILELTAPGFEPFQQELSTAAQVPQAGAKTDATQSSSIDECRLAASGGFASSAASEADSAFAYSVGGSIFSVTFELDEPATFRLIGSGHADHGSQIRVVIQGPAGELFSLLQQDGDVSIDESIELQSGTHTALFQAFGIAFTLGKGSDAVMADFVFELSACPIPADLNGDGAVDGLDLGILLAQWQTSGAADLNGDGVVDGIDLGILLASWSF